MKKINRIISILLALCMLVGTIGVLPVSAIEYSSDYAISNVTYVPTGTLGSTQDMLQWSDVGAASYRLEIYDENDIVIDYVIQNENYIPAAQILPYSGKFYVVVVPLDENNVSVWSGTESDMFTYTDTTAPTVAWLEDETVRSNDSEATVQFNNFDHLSACTYYYAVVDNGATAPTIDTSGTGIAANDDSDNYINLTDLTAGAKDIYLILKDQDGNASEPIMTTIPAYVPETTYSVKIFTTVSGYGTTTDLGGSISGAGDYYAGDTVTLTATPNGGYCAISWGSYSDVDLPSGSQTDMTLAFTMPESDVEITGSFRAHTLGTFYRDLEDGTHDSYCFYCGVTADSPAPHSDLTDYTGAANPDSRCDDCGADMHVHSYSTAWSSDENGHWHECECGETANFAGHTSSGAATEDAAEVCTVCGYEISPELGHQHSYASVWLYDETCHWRDCSCGGKFETAAHTSSGAATEDEAEVCTVCGYEISPALGHQHRYSSEWTKDDVGHWHACNCGDMTDYADHKYEGQDCEDGEKHRLICRYCGFQYRTNNLTSVFDHEYDNDCDSSCNGCGYERTVAPHSGTSCDICGWTFAQSAPTNLRWDTSNGTVATWDAVDGATNYIVELWKKGMISLRLISHVVSDTSFEFYLTTLSAGSYYFTVRAVTEDIKSNVATSDDIIITSGGTPIVIGGVSVRVDSIDGTAFIVDRDDIANGSVSDVNMTPITVSITLTNEQAVELINGWITSWEVYPSVDTYKNYIRPQLEDYSLADLEVIRNNIDRGMWPNDFIADVVIEEIKSREANDLVIAPGYIDANTDKFTVNFGGTQAEMNNDALQKILDNLGEGENLKISVKDVGAEALPKTLTEQGPYGGSESAIDKSIFKAAGIDNIEDRLKALGLINGNTDQSIIEDEFEYLYHYLTTDELMALRAELNESAHFEHHQKAVEWLDKMIERDAAVVDMSHGQLNISGILSKLEAIGYTGGDFTLGFLRQADLDMEHLEYIRHLMQQFVDDFDDSADELVLAWVKDAIAQKELEQENANITSMTVYGLKKNALLTDKQMQILYDMGLQNMDNPSIGQIKKLNLALEQMKLLYAEIDRTSAEEDNPAYQGEYDVLLKWLEKAIAEKEQEASDTPTYINTSGTNDGINPIFIGAVDVNIGAVKADGTTTPIAIKADRSDAVAWSTNIGSAALEEMLAMLGAVTTEDVVSNIKAYKVLDNGTLEAKASKVTVNADGTLTLSAMSDGNSTYVFLYVPAKASEEHTHSFEWVIDKEATETEDGIKHEECACGATQNENTVIPKTGTDQPNPFTDVEAGKYYYDAVLWAVGEGITSGTSATTFGPNDPCTRAQVVTFLWAANGRPAPKSTANPFTDIKAGKYYYDAVLWAVEQGITGGAGPNTFAPDRIVTRSEFVTFLWNAVGKPPVSISNPFPDVDAAKWYAQPVLWAYANGITSGMKDGTFGVKDPCTRAQVVTFLYKAYA